jgi:hypothetical protein
VDIVASSLGASERRRTARALAMGALTIATASPGVARADVKQECSEAYYAAQVLRDEGKLEDALHVANLCARDACAEFIRVDCNAWKREIEARVAQAAEAQRATVVVEVLDDEGALLPEATITLDGKPWIARVDGRPHEVPPGAHVIEARVDGAAPQRRSIEMRPGEKGARVAFTFEVRSEWLRGDGPSPWIAVGLGGAALVAGAVTGGLVLDAYATTQDECDDTTRTCSPAGLEAQERGQTLGPATTGLFVGGGLFVGAGLLWMLFDPSDAAAESTALVVVPALGPDLAALTLRGSF